MRVFFVAIVVDSNNFTLKGTEIVILEQLLVDILGVPNEKKRPLSLAASKSHWIVPNNYIPKVLMSTKYKFYVVTFHA